MPSGEVIVRTGRPSRSHSAFVRPEPPCSSTTRSPSAMSCATSRAIVFVWVSIPAAPPIFTTSVIFVAPFRIIKCLYRVQAGEGEAKSLVPAEGRVEGLHSVACRSLHQIIQGSHDNDALLAGIEFKADIAVIAARQNFGFGIAIDAAALFDQPDERLTPIRLAVESPEDALVQRLAGEDVGSDENAAHQFHRCRRESHRLPQFAAHAVRGKPPKLLQQFGGMAMAGRLEGTERAAAVRMMTARAGRRARRRGTHFGLDDQRQIAVDP